jgi:hypothetical protein
VAIARKHAPRVKLAFHLSSWADSVDAYMNTDPAHDVTTDADTDATFLRAIGAASADFITLDTNDHDADQNGNWWDATNTTLPTFHQALAFDARASTDLGLPLMWWQNPYGNTTMPDTCSPGACTGGVTKCGYKDNRLDYFFDHPGEYAAAGGFAMAFGAGNACETIASTDGGNFVTRAKAYYSGTPPTACE